MTQNRRALGIAALLSLGSCSIGYEINITARDGKLYFEPYEPGWFGRRLTAEVETFEVLQASKQRPLVWKIEVPNYRHIPIQSIAYGTSPSGFVVKSKPMLLEAGKLYLVRLSALGGGGERYFAISRFDHYKPPNAIVFSSK